MPATGRIVQYLVIFSTVLGVVFLAQVYGVLPANVFDFVAIGWVLFVIDSILTFTNPKVSYYMAFVLAILALFSSLPESAHYTFIENGVLLPSATFILGTLAQVLLLIFVPYHFIKERRTAR
ncbi:MAG: hypothetical protein LYZ69_02805 [Nitrososphaerales archaeon]|nr:hypothetical protein [Nitrososphaerales archaeon]